MDEAYAGDIIGFTTHGGVQLGDTITDGANLQFTGLPFFAPELFMTVILKNPLRTKQLQQGLAQLGEEGAIQVFRPEIGGPMLLGAVGQLQFEVVQHRLKSEYDADIRLEGCQYTGARWITADTPAELRAFTDAYPQRMALDAADALAFLCTSPYDVRLAQERFPEDPFPPAARARGPGFAELSGPRGDPPCPTIERQTRAGAPFMLPSCRNPFSRGALSSWPRRCCWLVAVAATAATIVRHRPRTPYCRPRRTWPESARCPARRPSCAATWTRCTSGTTRFQW